MPKTVIRIALFAVMFVAVGGCFVSASTMLNGWVGASESDLVSKWGAPTQSYKLDDGSRVLTFKQGPSCDLSFNVSSTSVVTGWSSRGSCPTEYRK